MAVIDVIERDRLAENVAAVGAFLKAALAERKGRFASIADVRGHGLFIGVEIAKTDAAREPDMDKAVDIINRLKDRGFLTSNASAYRNSREDPAAAGLPEEPRRRVPHRLRCHDGGSRRLNPRWITRPSIGPLRRPLAPP